MKLLESCRAVFFYRIGSQSDNIQHQGFPGSLRQNPNDVTYLKNGLWDSALKFAFA